MLPVTDDVTVMQAGEAVKIDSEPPDPFNGKVYLAREAKKLGLVDHIGYLDKALDRAKALARLDDPHVVQYSARMGLLGGLFDAAKAEPPLKVDRDFLDSLQTPRLMLLWKAE